MAAEQGIRLGARPLDRALAGRDPAAALGRFDRVYIGAEFCENLLEDRYAADAERLQALGKKVCLLTPLLSDKGAGLLDKLFSALLRRVRAGRLDPAGLEITVNDFGAAELARRRALPFRLSAGRQLSGNAFVQVRDRLELQSRRALEYFRGLGVARFELATSGSLPAVNFGGVRFGAGLPPFSLTLYYPYLNLTTTRTCLVGMPDIPAEVSVKGITCARECQACAFRVAHPWIKEKLYIRGNTVFMEFPEKFYTSERQLARRRIDRLVYCPFP
jgi:hypothetical protein